MSGDDENFEPRLGRMRATKGRKARKYLGRLLAAATLVGNKSRGRAARFDGSRIGRGAPVGRLLASRGSRSRQMQRRVVIKTRLMRLAGKGQAAAAAHLKYIQRDGVTREGNPGELYDARADIADGKFFLERSIGDRHQFRFIVSAEEGNLYADLKPFVRRLMAQMEEDLGTSLDWVAVDHFNTGHPHSHIMLRGVDERGQNLIIAREYIARGMRERASELVTLDLGPKTQLEIETRMRRDIGAERLTDIDRQLSREQGASPLVLAADRDPFFQSVRAGRLQTLERMGLAQEIAPGQWRLADDLEGTLKRMGERGDIIAVMNHELAARGRALVPSDRAVHDDRTPLDRPLVGRVAMRGLANELVDRHYLIVDGVDGRIHYIGIGKGEAVEPLAEGAIVRIVPAATGAREVDRTVAAVAATNNGRYDIAAHLRYDPGASPAFAETHVRRLEAMRRRSAIAQRAADGSWTIAPDHVARAAAYERDAVRDRPVSVEILSAVRLERLPRADAVTWLDREALATSPEPLRAKGFGGEVRAAQRLRRQWLIEQELADIEGEGVAYRPGALAALQRRELLRLARRLSRELGNEFSETRKGDIVEGRVTRRIDGEGGRYALVEKAKQFTLVPWKPVLERHIGKEVAGLMRESGVSWTMGRGRSGPEIS
jgi:type IV secretory pathway VirD2 relaxase